MDILENTSLQASEWKNLVINKEAFIRAMSSFQAKCPVIVKTRSVANRYKYASLDDIVKQVSPLLAEFGLSYTVKTSGTDKSVTATTVVYHVLGHSEESSFSVPIEEEAYMNDAQKAGSSLAYAKRYSFCNAFGILTGDQDDDGKSMGSGINPQDLYKRFSRHTETLMNNIDTVMTVKSHMREGNIEAAAEAWAEINEQQTLIALGLAPTKGGCFTVEEKKIFTSDEFKELYYRSASQNY